MRVSEQEARAAELRASEQEARASEARVSEEEARATELRASEQEARAAEARAWQARFDSTHCSAVLELLYGRHVAEATTASAERLAEATALADGKASEGCHVAEGGTQGLAQQEISSSSLAYTAAFAALPTSEQQQAGLAEAIVDMDDSQSESTKAGLTREEQSSVVQALAMLYGEQVAAHTVAASDHP